MGILEPIRKGSGANSRKKHFIRGRRKDDSVFSIEDARDVIATKKENALQEAREQIFEQKKDILAQQSATGTKQKVGTASIADIFGFNPIQSKQTNARNKDPEEIPQKYRKYYKLLLKMKNDVKEGLSKLTNENLAISVGKAKQDGIDPEIESFDSEFAISLMSSEQEALTEIEEAIRRIHDGTYGICELTGKPIEPQRLLAVPFARFSIEGQNMQEKARQPEVFSGSIFQTDQSTEELSEFEADSDE
ncbi:MAG: TraR/DksA C4-type zinc finger protein [Puniceicoccales bacterium]|jgi:RNA polymerase-binding transcription factor DksA|nr:TraR/DksA C4-type zinc finger protein [Puniceicoccales bacterium]